jgi:hypothetical protein
MIPWQLLFIGILNVTNNYWLLQKVTSYIAELLLRYFEDKKELFLFLNKTVKNVSLSRKLKMKPTVLSY